jgi:hypothetical protein
VGEAMNKPRVFVKVVAPNIAHPITLVFPGPRGMCSCGWLGRHRWTLYGASIVAQIHADETGHGLAEPLEWANG